MNETLGRRLVGATVLIGLGILLPFLLIQWLDGPEPQRGDGVRVYEITPGGEARPVADAAPQAPAADEAAGIPAPPEPESEPAPDPPPETPPQAPAAPAPAEAPPAGPSWLVQAGSFRSEENARILMDELAADFPAFYNEGRVGGVTYYRVLLGPFADEARAQNAASTLAARGYPARIRREP